MKMNTEVFLLFKPESKPQKQGDTESEFKRLTTLLNGMVVGPNFGHSGVQESLLTQAHRKPQLITVQVLGGQRGRGVCPMTPRTH